MPEITRLANGARILSENTPHVRSVSLGIWVRTGSRQDPDDRLGMAHFVEHMLFKGTANRSALEIAKDIDAVGGILNAQTAKEYTVYYVKVLDESLNKATDVLLDLFLNSTLDPIEIEKEKGVVLQEIGMTEDTPDDYIGDLFSEAYFHNTPLGTPILGSSETVGDITREDIRAFMRNFYDPDSIVVAAVGNIEHQQLVDLVAPKLAALPVCPRNHSLTKPPMGGNRAIHVKDLEQVHFTLGALGPAMRDDARWTYIVLNTLLGGSMSSMLFQEVREKLGLVYSIYSYLSAYQDCGVMGIYAAAAPENIVQTMETVGAQLKRIKQGDLGEMTLDEIKALIRGNLLLAREGTESRMSAMAKNEMYYGREVTIEEILEKVNTVTTDGVVELAQGIFTADDMTLVTLGSDTLQGFDLDKVL